MMLHTIAAVIAAAATVLAARLILLLAVIGAFAIAYIALQQGTWIAMSVLVAYGVFILLPIIGLEIRTPRPGG